MSDDIKQKYANLKTPEGRMSYPFVYTQNNYLNKLHYEVTLIFKGADLAALKAAANEVVAAKWGANRPANLRSPFINGDAKNKELVAKGKTPRKEYEGAVLMRFKSERKPRVIGLTGEDIAGDEFYAGCYGKVCCGAPYAYDAGGNVGVAFGLLGVLKTKDGEPFGVSVDVNKAFSEETGGSNNAANYAPPTDDIPF